MLKLLTCVQGHFWEVAQPSENGQALAAARCPVCRAAADELPLVDLAPSEAPAEIATTPPPVNLKATAGFSITAASQSCRAGYEILAALARASAVSSSITQDKS